MIEQIKKLFSVRNAVLTRNVARFGHKNLRPNPQALGVIPLKPSEASWPIRMRTKLEVFKQLEGLIPTQVGLFMTRLNLGSDVELLEA